MTNPICSKCNLLPTHHKCVICKSVLVCPKCCDKQDIDNLNKITCTSCHSKEITSINCTCDNCINLIATRECMQYNNVLLCEICFQK